MSDGDALLRGVLAAPDDDAPRLVYADWLDEQGRPEQRDQAEYIRLSIEMFRSPLPGSFGGRRRLGWLLRRHRERWCNGTGLTVTGHELMGVTHVAGGVAAVTPESIQLSSVAVLLERGFVEEVQCHRLLPILQHSGDWVRRWPLRRLTYPSWGFGPAARTRFGCRCNSIGITPAAPGGWVARPAVWPDMTWLAPTRDALADGIARFFRTVFLERDDDEG